MSAIPLGRFVWYQLNATDVNAARDFYAKAIGWKTEVWPSSDDPYYLLMRDSAPIGGVMALTAEAAASGEGQHWMSYISTPDVDKSVMEARDHGAQVLVPPTDLPEVGRFAALADPQGAIFAMFAPTSPPEDTPFEPELGDVSWHELMTNDYKAGLKFYQSLFKWQKRDAIDMGDAGQYQLFGRHDKDIGGMYDTPAEMPAPPLWLVYFRVKDINESMETIKQLGGKILNGPMEVPGGDLVAQCIDPQGGAFAIHSAKA